MLEQSCGCTVSSIPKGKEVMIGPRGSTDLILKWKVSKPGGKMSSVVKFGTNDPDKPEFTLAVIGSVISGPPEDPPKSVTLKIRTLKDLVPKK